MITATDTAAEHFLDTARQNFRIGGGSAALDALEWADLLGSLGDRELRFAAAATFRAQGHELASTPAVGLLMAQPYVELLGLEPDSVIAAIVRTSPRRGETVLTVGDLDGRRILVDRLGHGVTLHDASQFSSRPLEVPGLLGLVEHDLRAPAPVLDLPHGLGPVTRRRSIALGRVALAAEMLGAAEGAVELAVEHARLRTQFGQTLGGFQAVRHLLAWAETDCAALAAVVRQAVWFDTESPERYDEIVKAIAGRNARSACERALQVLGGIGFTTEHDHHHHHSRVLALDSLLGTSAALTHRLGTRVRERGTNPDWTAAALATDA